jgi:hypothetical protein
MVRRVGEACRRYTVCIIHFHIPMWVCWFWYHTLYSLLRKRTYKCHLLLSYKFTIIFYFISYMLIIVRIWTLKIIRVGAIVFPCPVRFNPLMCKGPVPYHQLKTPVCWVLLRSLVVTYTDYFFIVLYNTPYTRECIRPWKCTSVSLVSLMEVD